MWKSKSVGVRTGGGRLTYAELCGLLPGAGSPDTNFFVQLTLTVLWVKEQRFLPYETPQVKR